MSRYIQQKFPGKYRCKGPAETANDFLQGLYKSMKAEERVDLSDAEITQISKMAPDVARHIKIQFWFVTSQRNGHYAESYEAICKTYDALSKNQ